MVKIIQPRILKGFRDYPPEKMHLRLYLQDILKKLFELYGFQPFDTPILEYAEILEGKYGEEGEKLMYKFKDHGDRTLAMRYDLTIPLARFIAMNPQLILPFRRYHLGPVWRADKPQHGRFREFWQCDIDIVGTDSYLADVEVLSLAYDFFQKIGIEKFIIRVNDRRVLNALLTLFGFKNEAAPEVLRSIDKLDKIGPHGVEQELSEKGFNSASISELLSLLTMHVTIEETLSMLKEKLLPSQASVQVGLVALENIFRVLKNKGKDPGFFSLDLSLARGLDYYTSTIYEAVVEEPKIGSLLGGGRYDNLIGIFCGKTIPATGFSFGFERIVTVLEELQLLRSNQHTIKVLVTIFTPELAEYSVTIANILRKNNINVEVYPDDQTKLAKQLTYANKKNIPFAIIAGPEEKKNNVVTLKDLKKGSQETSTVDEIKTLIK